MKLEDLYRLLLESDEPEDDDVEPVYLRGEYWFDESGDTMYADGDIGDMNHEMYVEQRVTYTILDYFNLELDEFRSFDLSEYFDDIKGVLLEDVDDNDEDALEKFEDAFWDDPKQLIENYIVDNFREPREKITKMLYMRDARAYAIEEWNWSRVHGNHIEVNRLTNDQINTVSTGIWNALEEEGKTYDENERIAAGKAEYYISTYTGKRYQIKLDDMDSPESISDLEESPIQKEPGFSNLDRLDRQKMQDFYKDRPFGDSFQRSKRKRPILERAVINLSDLPEKTKITIKKSKYYDEGYELKMFIQNVPMAALEIVRPHGSSYWNIHAGMNKELQGKGFGPLLYDIAIEFITNYLKGIAISTYGNNAGGTSERAQNVWRYYYKERKDVKKIPNIGSRRDHYGFNNFPDESLNPKDTPWLWAGYQKDLDYIPQFIEARILEIKLNQ